jgi:hypothetical protein
MYRGLGIAARVTGDHAGPNSTTAEPLSLVTTVFGPRLHGRDAQPPLCVFDEGLVGIANAFHSLISEG